MLFHLIISIVVILVNKIKLYNLANIFIFLLYIFHLGQLFIKIFSDSYIYSFDVSRILYSDTYFSSVIFSIGVISATLVGVIVSYQGKKQEFKKIQPRYTVKQIMYIGWIIFIPTFALELYYSLNKLIISMSNGYLDVLQVEGSGILSLLARFHIVGLSFILLSAKKKNSILIFIMYTAYCIICMLSGSRIYYVISLCVFSYLLLASDKIKLNIKKCVIIGSLGILFLVLLNTVSVLRADTIRNFEYIKNVFIDNLKNNPLLNALEEFGGTIYTVGLVLDKVPEYIPYSYGTQFIESFISVLPNIGGRLTDINLNSNFVLKLNTIAIGGSYVAEMFYSFGYWGILVASFWGYFIGKIAMKIEQSICYKNYIGVGYYIMTMYTILLWVRGAWLAVPRSMIYGFLFLLIIMKIYNNFIIRRIK